MREVGRSLHGDVQRHHEPRKRDRPEVIGERGLGRLRHPRAGLRAEVLHDHLLQVAVALVQVAQRDQRLDALAPRLSDADQDAARVRDRQAPGAVDRVQAHVGQLVGRAEVRPAALRQAPARRLEHDALRRADLAQGEQLVVVENARVGVREQARLTQHEAGAVRQVGRGRGEAEPVELVARRPVAQLGLVAEREQGLVAPRKPAGVGDREHLVLAQVAALSASRRARERAVVADVPAEVRERDEDLRRERDERARRAFARALAQLGQRRPAVRVGEGLVRRQRRGADTRGQGHGRIVAPMPREPSLPNAMRLSKPVALQCAQARGELRAEALEEVRAGRAPGCGRRDVGSPSRGRARYARRPRRDRRCR